MVPVLPRAVPFVGRAPDREAVERWFEEGARLVTLLGPGGIGKTALAAEIAGRRAGAISPIVWCSLEDRSPLDAVAGALATGVGVIAEALAARAPLLLVLDNVDDAAGDVAPHLETWLEAAPGLEVLATSRRRLALAAEIVHEVGGLGADAVPFLERTARRRAAGFVLRSEDVVHAQAIAARLDGSPLALEMAAARLPLVGARALLAAIEASPAALQRDVRGPARHASLEAAVAGSILGLGPLQRGALAELAVFRGGFTLAAVEGIVDLPTGLHASVLGELRDASLLRTRDATSARLDLHGAVRGWVVTHETPRIAVAAERHAAWFAGEAERAAEAAIRDRAARAWIAAERENLLAVVARVHGAEPVTARTAEPALRALVALGPWLLARGSIPGLADLVGPVVERTRNSGADPRLTARALLLRGALRRSARPRDALKDLLAAETIARSIGDAILGADVGIELARSLLVAGEPAAAEKKIAEALAAYTRAGARAREAEALALSASTVSASPEVVALRERAAALVAGEDVLRGPRLVELGRAYAAIGDQRRAESTFAEAIAIAERTGDPLLDAGAHFELGVARVAAGEARADAGAPTTTAPIALAAEDALVRARDGFELAGQAVDAAIAGGYLGYVARARGDSAEAYTLFAGARDAAHAGGRRDDAARFEAELAMPAVSAMRPPPNALLIAIGGHWFAAPGAARVGLERRKNLALLLDHLARGHAERPGIATSSAALFQVGWPGEKAQAAAASHRVRVAIATLRKLGLGDRLATLPDGYAFPADLVIARV